MSRSSSGHGEGFDPQRLVAAAVEAFLAGESDGRQVEPADRPARRRRGGAVAVGVLVGLGAHVLYRRARELDLEQVARSVEQRLAN